MPNDVPVFSLWNEFVGWVLDHTEKFPKKVCTNFSLRIEALAINILEDIVRASYSKQKNDYLENANLNLNVLRVLLRLACSRQYLANNSYEFAMRKVDEAGKMIGGWQKSLREKI